MLLVVVASVIIWQQTRDTLPATIRIATAAEGGLYHRTGQLLGEQLALRTGAEVELVSTRGSVENRSLLLDGKVDLAILQLGAVEKTGIAAVSPLYPEVVHVVARRERGIDSVLDLEGRKVFRGQPGSGMRKSAQSVLDHYDIEIDHTADSLSYFGQLLEHPEYDAAIVTTGFLNADLARLMSSGAFDLIAIDDADALAIRYSHIEAFEIPRGLYSGRPSIPAQSIPTVATTTFLAVTPDASPLLVQHALAALHQSYLQSDIPGLMTESEAAQWAVLPLHRAARGFYDPYEGLGLLANLMETLSAVKELLFALGAGLYLAWTWWRQQERKEQLQLLGLQKERLDVFLEQTVAVEKAQMRSTDIHELQRYLDDVTRIKIGAISELTHEALRGDRMFSIFLTQCSGVSRKIEAKLAALYQGHALPVPRKLEEDSG
jgi:TRAP transporter TAXI family solute receptor